MSQIIKVLTSSGPIPPIIPTSFPTDSGTAIPAANVLNVFTAGSGTEGIMTSGSGNTITISLTNPFLKGTAQTIGATTANINVNIPVPVSDSVVSIRANIAGYAKTAGLAIGGELIGAVKNVGGTLTVVGIPDVTKNNDTSLICLECHTHSIGHERPCPSFGSGHATQ